MFSIELLFERTNPLVQLSLPMWWGGEKLFDVPVFYLLPICLLWWEGRMKLLLSMPILKRESFSMGLSICSLSRDLLVSFWFCSCKLIVGLAIELAECSFSWTLFLSVMKSFRRPLTQARQSVRLSVFLPSTSLTSLVSLLQNLCCFFSFLS